jgi:BirA family biotin operon repressor/biotin-[acetyl-CoA-carboxylase] ligase
MSLYLRYLSKRVPKSFKGMENTNFMGIICCVSVSGKLQVLLENDSVAEYNLKEVQFIVECCIYFG